MNQNKLPLYERVMNHHMNQPISLHVPGHKNGLLYKEEMPLFNSFLEYDLTELTGLDDLHDPSGAIAEAEQLLTNLYKTRKSYFLVNGSTVGNLAMILAACHEGDRVLVQRNCHKSILNGLMLANVRPLFISPEINNSAQINLDLVKEAFERYPNIRACIFTYPDYYGRTFDLKKIIELSHTYGALVLIDEAHGPHLQLEDEGAPFPPSSLKLGADMVVHSAHKVLPAMTMGSYLHINSNRIDEEKVSFYLSMLQSSSPSYPIMISLDIARHYLASFTTEDIDYTIQMCTAFTRELNQMNGLAVNEVVRGQDPIRITVCHEALTGFELQASFEKVGIYPELADLDQVLFILPLLKKHMEFPFDEAIERIKKISWESKIELKKKSTVCHTGEVYGKLTELVFPYKEMLSKPYEWIRIKDAKGRAAAKMMIPYPPGIPLLLPGEEITAGHIDQLLKLIAANARFQGEVERLDAGELAVFI